MLIGGFTPLYIDGKKQVLGSTIGGEISAIISYLNNKGHQLNRRNMDGLRRLLKGMNNACKEQDPTRGTTRHARPLTSHMLLPMLEYLDQLGSKKTEMAVLALGKACGLRPDNYLFTKNKRFISIGALTWIPKKHPTRLLININVGKTIKDGTVIQYVMDCKCPSKYQCVVHLIRPLVRHRLNDVNAPLFLKPNGKIFDALAMRALLNLLCKQFELDSHFYTPYCLRVGAACETWWNSGDLWLVMQRFYWKSASSCRRYLRSGNVDLYKFIPPSQQLPGRPLPPPV